MRDAKCVSKTIQIRNMPEKTYRAFKTRAAELGLSLSEYLLRELRKIAERPTPEQIRKRLAKLPPVRQSEDPVDIIRRVRDATER